MKDMEPLLSVIGFILCCSCIYWFLFADSGYFGKSETKYSKNKACIQLIRSDDSSIESAVKYFCES